MTTGLQLSRRFYESLVAPIIARALPQLSYAAARLGDGSEVLGFDTEMSADHNYGPTVQIILDAADFAHADVLMAALDAQLPERFEDWTIRYESLGRHVRADGWHTSDHGAELMTLEALLRRQVGAALGPWSNADWLSFPEQRLLTLIAGAVFRDDGGQLADLRQRLDYFPRDVRLLRLATEWDAIGEERAFVGRTGELGDALGSRVIGSRLVEHLMRIAFLVERRYAPYPKWFGTAFARLDSATVLLPLLAEALEAADWQQREAAIARAAEHLAQLQLEHGIPGAVPPRIASYFTRPFQVINADAIAAGLRGAIADPMLRQLPVGGIDQLTGMVPILTAPEQARRLVAALVPDQPGE
ncbi:DUF4037 domain-containing protein [Devosia sp. Root105]|uniref:DUF4037 domain-containing protein n=1 Tax=Devosia sp. Root105 TaxID=1736423 RepID=UPI0006F3B454|nr:DUF4037 domain-containing protein [Devosia sp. Root105]KQU93402.1 hypothetical protein ASC68_22875 [Devosia sp. Root105]